MSGYFFLFAVVTSFAVYSKIWVLLGISISLLSYIYVLASLELRMKTLESLRVIYKLCHTIGICDGAIFDQLHRDQIF